jgi:hypothetical protein
MYGKQYSSICVDGTYRYQSVGYSFINVKEQDGAAKKPCLKPDVLGLQDGRQYNLTAMGEGQRKELVDLAVAERVENIPEKFKVYQM